MAQADFSISLSGTVEFDDENPEEAQRRINEFLENTLRYPRIYSVQGIKVESSASVVKRRAPSMQDMVNQLKQELSNRPSLQDPGQREPTDFIGKPELVSQSSGAPAESDT